MSAGETIFALSSGTPPAAVAVVRVSGPEAGVALKILAGPLPLPRRASLRTLVHPDDGTVLDRALVLWIPGPPSATGEDCAELHLHGGRAVVQAVESALGQVPGLRPAQPGEFTRRAFANGRIDLAEAEGLADLLEAETELQRRAAQALAGGALSRAAQAWRERVLSLAARIEAMLDFADEGEVGEDDGALAELAVGCGDLARDLSDWLDRPRAEVLREGFRVVLAGPPNAGKSTLFNALVEDEAAIIAAEPGTTRDVLQRAVAIAGAPFVFVDTAGLREDGAGEVERIGIARAREQAQRADLVLWLGEERQCTARAPVWEIEAQSDRPERTVKAAPAFRLSARTGQGLDALRRALVERASAVMPTPGEVALNRRQHSLLSEVAAAVRNAGAERDALLMAEHLRLARQALDRLTGRAGVEDMLDSLFGRFCIGK